MGGTSMAESESKMVSLHVTAAPAGRLAGAVTTNNNSEDKKGLVGNFLAASLASDDSKTNVDENGCPPDNIPFRTPPREILRRANSDATDYRRKSVGFALISQRSYSLVLGDHPCCSMGCPLALGWDYSQAPNMSVDQYEATRPPRRSKESLRTTWEERRQMLADVSDNEVKRQQRKLHREKSCQRKHQTRVCSAFFEAPR